MVQWLKGNAVNLVLIGASMLFSYTTMLAKADVTNAQQDLRIQVTEKELEAIKADRAKRLEEYQNLMLKMNGKIDTLLERTKRL